MRLLLFTQKVDSNDSVLGFFHQWIIEISKEVDELIVICLEKGEYQLPSNVVVLSLGKEGGKSRIKYISNLYKYILNIRKYDKVLVHMNQEYVLLGGILWKMFGKKIYMWRNHPEGNFLTKISVLLSTRTFCTSTYSYINRYKKNIIMPVGILMSKFETKERKVPNSILVLGRVSPVKKVEVIIKALNILDTEDVNFKAYIYGDPLPIHKEYYEEIKEEAKALIEKNKVIFMPGVPNKDVPEIYSKSEIYVNATPSGSFDKTILESMSANCIPLVSNLSLLDDISNLCIFKEEDSVDLSLKLKKILSLEDGEKDRIIKENLRYVKENHSLEKLINKLMYNL